MQMGYTMPNSTHWQPYVKWHIKNWTQSKLGFIEKLATFFMNI
jgi:hypothetical protein